MKQIETSDRIRYCIEHQAVDLDLRPLVRSDPYYRKNNDQLT